jgi:predicted nuclease with TOPRIM domain
MTNLAEPIIYSLPYPAVSPSENAILNALLAELQAVREEVAQLREEQGRNHEEILDLRQQVLALGSHLDDTEGRLALDIALDRQRISKLERIEPRPMEKDRADILRALLAANNGKLLAKELRKKMHLSKERFSKLLDTCDFIETKPYHLDRRQLVIILK